MDNQTRNQLKDLEAIGADEDTHVPHRLMKHFVYQHLPENLQTVSRIFARTAQEVDLILESGPEKAVALRKLLEAKDCAVRSEATRGQ